jgi:hypothetical protein
MATLNIEGRKVTVDDSFLKLSPEEQNSTVDEIHKSLQKPVTDPALLAKLNAPDSKPVTDPAILSQLNAPDTKPIHIGAPDGSIVEFPAGTSDDVIKGAMAKAYPSAFRRGTRWRSHRL